MVVMSPEEYSPIVYHRVRLREVTQDRKQGLHMATNERHQYMDWFQNLMHALEQPPWGRIVFEQTRASFLKDSPKALLAGLSCERGFSFPVAPFLK